MMRNLILAILLTLTPSLASAVTSTFTEYAGKACYGSNDGGAADNGQTCTTNSDCTNTGVCVTGEVQNPERGWWRQAGGFGLSMTGTGQLANFNEIYQDFKQTIAYARITVPAPGTLTASWFNPILANLDVARDTGVKVAMRFRYCSTNCNDGTVAQQVDDIAQMNNIFDPYEDVIAYMEAGFVGNFGEWYPGPDVTWSTSTGQSNIDSIINGLMTSWPAGRMIALRYPKHMRAYAGHPPGQACTNASGITTVTSTSAYNRSNIARLAHHNDCVGYNSTDRGTYLDGCVDAEKSFLDTQSNYTGTFGEPCYTNGAAGSQTTDDCSAVMATMARHHWTTLNDRVASVDEQYVSWKTQGCWDDITKKLGYRFVLTQAVLPATAQAGSNFAFQITMRNDGFARPINPRVCYAVLDNGTNRTNIPMAMNIQKAFTPGGESNGTAVTVTENLPIPAGFPSGTYTVALWCPDASANLRTPNVTAAIAARYSIRTANAGTWDSTNGYTELGTMVVGSVDQCNSNSDCASDGQVCTTDTCVNPSLSSSTCSYVNNALSCTSQDGAYCNGTDTCSGGTCSVHTGSPCSGTTPTCIESTDSCAPADGCTTNSDCSDGNGCTTDTCQASGGTAIGPLPSGRIAVSSDGNKHDCDDIFASAVSTAMLAASGNAAKLVYYGHSDHHWDSAGTCSSVTTGAGREAAMSSSTLGVANTWGGFDTSVFLNCTQDSSGTTCDASCQACVDALEAAIEASLTTDRLYIIAAGPMDIIGRAMNEASTGRGAVTLISHSSWNEDHSDLPEGSESPAHTGWTWNEMKAAFTAPTYIDLPDQNGPLNTVSWSYYDTAWNDSTDTRLNQLWDRGQVARDTGSGGISWPDFSDAGMVYWLISGQGSTTAERQLTPQEATAAFTGSECVNTNNTATCTDGLYCNGADACSGGGCNNHAGNPCGAETCQEATDTCVADECDSDGQCADTNPCTTNTCVNPDGDTSVCSTTNNTASCNDGLYCTLTDTCNGAGTCVGSGVKCAAGEVCLEATDQCVVDQCNTAADCAEIPNDNICTTDTCVNAAASNSTCSRVNNTIACSDGLFCNGGDSCITGACTVHTGNPCPLATTCNETTDLCDSTAVDACDSNTDCAESPTDEVCTTDECVNPALETSTCTRTNNTGACDDELVCNGDGTDTCSGGTCSVHPGYSCSTDYECIEEWTSREGVNCHHTDTPRIDEPNIAEFCTTTPSQTTTFNATLGTQPNRGVVVQGTFAQSSGAVSPVCTAAGAPQPTATYGGVAMELKHYWGVANPTEARQACHAIFYLDDPPVGTSEVVVSWPFVVPASTGLAIPLYNVMVPDVYVHDDSFACSGFEMPNNPGTPDVSVTADHGRELALGFAVADEAYTHASENDSDITAGVQIAGTKCGVPAGQAISAGMQFIELESPGPVGDGFTFYVDEFDSNAPANWACALIQVGNPMPFNTTTTTLPDVGSGTYINVECKCKIK